MSPSTEIGLFAPPIMAGIVFVLTWNIERATNATGTLSRGRRKLYASMCVLLMFVAYIMLWQDELKAAWLAGPVWMSLGLAGIAASLVYFVITRRKEEPSETCETSKGAPANVMPKPERSVAKRIFAWIVILWGVAGLLGGVAAIVRNALSH